MLTIFKGFITNQSNSNFFDFDRILNKIIFSILYKKTSNNKRNVNKNYKKIDSKYN